jgi:hypothetical protein
MGQSSIRVHTYNTLAPKVYDTGSIIVDSKGISIEFRTYRQGSESVVYYRQVEDMYTAQVMLEALARKEGNYYV